MRVHHIVAALTWIATVTATSESDSRGNWSNEKKLLELNYEQGGIRNQTKEEIIDGDRSSGAVSQQERSFNSSDTAESTRENGPEELNVQLDHELNIQLTKQVVQPYVLPLEGTLIQEDIRNESTKNVSRPVRTSQSTYNETATVEYVPSQEILLQNLTSTSNNYPAQDSFNDLVYLNAEDHVDAENEGNFGQRVRSSSFRYKGNENPGRGRLRPLDSPLFAEEFRKQQHRKGPRPLVIKKPNVSNSIVSPFSKDRHSVASGKATESQRALVQKKPEEEYVNTDYVQSNRIKLPGASWTKLSEENRNRDPQETVPSSSAPVLQVSLGKFTGPIVVADLPRQKKYSFTTTTEYAVVNDEAQSTPSLLEATRSKAPESNYLATSSAILNPLQVGVALMNVGQDINSVNDPVTFTKDYLQDEPVVSQATVSDVEGIVRGDDAAGSGNSSVQVDQLTQQEQISEVVASNLPTQSVEIQKSVEVFHTAPVHEIHYPVEFVPYAQQSNLKQRQQQTDYRKLQRGQRPGQLNVYKSNEILDESVSSSNQERGRYEYSVTEDDVNSASNSQVDQAQGSAELKAVFDAREQLLDEVQYNQTAGKYSRIQRIPDTITAEGAKQNEYDPAKGVSFGGQPVGILDNLPALANVESAQGSQEAPQILLTKPPNGPPTEVRFLMAVPQHYPAEKVPYQVEKVIEKQITIPQPFPVHVPVDRVVEKQVRVPYPVHVEKVIEKKVPVAIQRFIIPVPIHFRIPQPVPIPVEKVVEKSVPVPVPVPVEKVIEKTVHLHRPHPLDVEKIRPYPSDNPKPVKALPQIYNEGNFQQIRQQNFQVPVGPSHEKIYFNASQFYGSGYLNRPYVRQPSLQPALLPKKFGSYSAQYPHSLIYSSSNGNNGNLLFYGRSFPEKDQIIIDEYVGPVPRKVQVSLGIQSKSLQYALPDVQSTMRRTRQEAGNTGSFRQSKMEYGFKPPMVPSIQYDEQTATKVE